MPRLPPELLALVVGFVPARQKAALAALMCVDSTCYALAGRRLYAELRVNRRNLAGVLRGLDRGACACACASACASAAASLAASPAPSPAAPAPPTSPATPTTPTPPAGPAAVCAAAARPPSPSPSPCSPHTLPVDRARPRPCACAEAACARPKSTYPSPASDRRKRALLAFTRFLTVESVPDCRCWSPPSAAAAATAACPLNKSLLPNVRVVRVMASVPQHAMLAFERRRPGRA